MTTSQGAQESCEQGEGRQVSECTGPEGCPWQSYPHRSKHNRRVQTLESAKIKVNDLNGNPIEIAAAVIWRVRDAAKAVLQVENYAAFVQIQSETSVRKLASSHPYDDTEADLTERRGGERKLQGWSAFSAAVKRS